MTRNTLIAFADGLRILCLGRTKYYTLTNPSSPSFDPDAPGTIPVGTAPNSPRVFVESEIDAYIDKLIDRARSDSAGQARQSQASAALARKMVAARQSRRTTPRAE
ncbi:MAG: hypothetical protein IV103_08280 [Zoogloea sp.]|nr:hypothetical protein [Zoogloea sp.]